MYHLVVESCPGGLAQRVPVDVEDLRRRRETDCPRIEEGPVDVGARLVRTMKAETLLTYDKLDHESAETANRVHTWIAPDDRLVVVEGRDLGL